MYTLQRHLPILSPLCKIIYTICFGQMHMFILNSDTLRDIVFVCDVYRNLSTRVHVLCVCVPTTRIERICTVIMEWILNGIRRNAYCTLYQKHKTNKHQLAYSTCLMIFESMQAHQPFFQTIIHYVMGNDKMKMRSKL